MTVRAFFSLPALLLLGLAPVPPKPPSASPPRARDLGITFGGQTGALNAITDVAGVEVGLVTLVSGEGPLVVGQGPVRTGVTAVLPRGRAHLSESVFAATYALNGNGEMTGTHWVNESGLLTGPVMLTNTNSVGVVRDAVISWGAQHGMAWELGLPVVAETYDGLLNDVDGFHVKPAHAWRAIDEARGGAVAEGSVGGGTGMMCHGFKGGTGTASRRLPEAMGGYTLGVLVQANHGRRPLFSVEGVPVGEEIKDLQPCWLARRVPLGIGKMGGLGEDSSGDIFLAFSTQPVTPPEGGRVAQVGALDNAHLNPLFEATVQATQEAILNALLAAGTQTGADGIRVFALPRDRLLQAMRKYGRLGASR